MSRRPIDLKKLLRLILFGILSVVGVILMIAPPMAGAEGNEPTNTLVPTHTMTPTNTSIPPEIILFETSTPQPVFIEEEKSAPQQPVDTSGGATAKTGIFQGTNLCLIGAIVVGAIIVMGIVVFGVVQRIRT